MAGLGLQLPYAGQSLDDMLQKLTETQAATKLANAKLAIEQQNADTERQRTMADMLHQHTMDALSEKIRTAAEQEKSDALGAKSIMGQSSETPLTPDQYGVAARSGISLKPIVTGSTNFALPFGGTVPIPTNIAAGRGLTDKEQSDQDANDAIDALNLPADQKVRLRATLRHPELGTALNAMNKPDTSQLYSGVYQGKPATVRVTQDGQVIPVPGLSPTPPAALQTGPIDPNLTQHYLNLLKNPMSGVTLSQVPKPYHDLVVSQLDPQDLRKLSAQDITMVNTARSVLPHFDKVQELAEQINAMGLAGSVGGRIDQMAAGESSAADIAGLTPEQRKVVGQFATEASLLKTAIAKAHVGVRGAGAVGVASAFEKILAPGNKDLQTYLGNLAGARDFMQGYSDMGSATPSGSTGGTSPKEKTLPNGQVLQQQSDGTWKIIR
jgi:hypothetical protein